jgi:hypothetical protein
MYLSDIAVWLPEEAYNLLSLQLKKELDEEWSKDEYPDFVGKNFSNIYYRQVNRWEGSDPYKEWKEMFDLFNDEDILYDYCAIGEEYEDIEVATGEMFFIKRTIHTI